MPLTRNRIVIACVIALSGLWIAAYRSISWGTVTYFVDDVAFSVPKHHLNSGEFFLLPRRQVDGFNFVLDPDAAPGAQVIVSVERRALVCRPDKVAAAPFIRGVCAGKQPDLPGSQFSAASSRLYLDRYRDRWEYFSQSSRDDPTATPFAACSQTGMKIRSESCYSMGLYPGVIYSILYPDDQVARLAHIRQSIEDSLSRWRVEK